MARRQTREVAIRKEEQRTTRRTIQSKLEPCNLAPGLRVRPRALQEQQQASCSKRLHHDVNSIHTHELNFLGEKVETERKVLNEISSNSSSCGSIDSPLPRRKRARVPSPPPNLLRVATPSLVPSLPSGVTDLDADSRDDSESCAEYQPQLKSWLHQQEAQPAFVVTPHEVLAIQNSNVIGLTQRGLLTEWILSQRLDASTLHLASGLLDRSLSKIFMTDTVQAEALVAACLHISVKTDSCDQVALIDIRQGLHSDVTPDAIIAMEAMVCSALSFKLHQPTVTTFLPRYLRAAFIAPGSREAHLSAYFADLAVSGVEGRAFLPSRLAAACVRLALLTTRRAAWTPTLTHETGVRASQLSSEVRYISQQHQSSGDGALRGVWRKFACAQKMYVAQVLGLNSDEISEAETAVVCEEEEESLRLLHTTPSPMRY